MINWQTLIFLTSIFLLFLAPTLQSSGNFISLGPSSNSNYPPVFRVDPSFVNLPVGSSFNVTLKIDNSRSFDGLDTVISYDTSIRQTMFGVEDANTIVSSSSGTTPSPTSSPSPSPSPTPQPSPQPEQ